MVLSKKLSIFCSVLIIVFYLTFFYKPLLLPVVAFFLMLTGQVIFGFTYHKVFGFDPTTRNLIPASPATDRAFGRRSTVFIVIVAFTFVSIGIIFSPLF